MRTRIALALLALTVSGPLAAFGQADLRAGEVLDEARDLYATATACEKRGAYRAIWEIQYQYDTPGVSPYVGQVAYNVRGIVTANFQDNTGGPRGELNGFFMQAHEPDCDEGTSDAIFVNTGYVPVIGLAPGMLVQVDGGTVWEERGPPTFVWQESFTSLRCIYPDCEVRAAAAATHEASDNNDLLGPARLAAMLDAVASDPDSVTFVALERAQIGFETADDAVLYVEDPASAWAGRGKAVNDSLTLADLYVRSATATAAPLAGPVPGAPEAIASANGVVPFLKNDAPGSLNGLAIIEFPLPDALEHLPPADEAQAAAWHEAREGMLVTVSEDATVAASVDGYFAFAIARGVGKDRYHRLDGGLGVVTVVDGTGYAEEVCGEDGFGDVRVFDTVLFDPANGSRVYGPLVYGFNFWKIQQADDAYCLAFAPGSDDSWSPDLHPAPAADADTITFGSLNAENLFDLDEDPVKLDELTHPTPIELRRKLRKLALAVCEQRALNQPDVIALQEVENERVLAMLATAIEASCGARYRAETLGAPDERGIQNAFLLKEGRVRFLSAISDQGCTDLDRGVTYEIGDDPPAIHCPRDIPFLPNFLFNRPPTRIEIEVDLAGEARRFWVYDNHFKSKGPSTSCTIPDCTDWRVDEALWLNGRIRSLYREQGEDALVVAMGDFNDFEVSPPLENLTLGPVQQRNGEAQLHNTWLDLAGPEDFPGGHAERPQGGIARYSYVYNGIAQVLDHVLVSPALNRVERTVSPRHLNNDPPGYLANWETVPERVSDHDLLVVAFRFRPGDPTGKP